jgi:hypothetical protein
MRPSVLIIAAIVISSTGILAFKSAESEKTSHIIEYKVTCSDCEITYRDEHGNSKDIAPVKDAWSYKFKGDKGQFIYVSALNKTGETTKVTILKDGQVFATDEIAKEDLAARTGTIL